MPTDTSPLYGLRAPTLADAWGLGAQRLRQLRDDVEAALTGAHAAVAASAAQTFPSAAYTTCVFGTVVADRNVDVNAAAGTLTIEVAGTYRISGAVCFEAHATGVRHAAIYVNGVARRQGSAPGDAAGSTAANVSAILVLAVGDIVTLRGNQNSGGDRVSVAPFQFTNLGLELIGH